MAKTRQLEDRLAELSALDLHSDAARETLARALHDKSSFVLAKAAQLVGKAKLTDLAEQLEGIFPRFIADAGSDKGCSAKLAIATTLYELGIHAQETFVSGIHHVQMEPAFGGPVDTAAELRGMCGLGLVRIGYRDVLTELADLLADSERQTRIMAARALAYAGREEAALPLRVKILMGDRETDVMGECFAAILQLTPRQGLALVARMIDSRNDDVAQEAAIALGSSRLSEAFALLRQRWEREISPSKRQVLLMPLALLRMPEAIDMLMGVVQDGGERLAASAVEALAIYRSDDAIRERVLAAAGQRTGAVRDAVQKAFGR